MGGEMTRRSPLVEGEEEMEEGSHHHHPEEMEINLVVNTDRRVSLMVMYRVPQLLKCFPLNVSKNRRDHLLHRFQRLKILIKISPVSVLICALT